ncbi:MAG: hypothetical protein ACRDMV_10905 [Streptosporangiales bacterium]
MITPTIDGLPEVIADLRRRLAALERPRGTGTRPSGSWMLVTPLTLPKDTLVTLTPWDAHHDPVGMSVDNDTGVFTFGRAGWWTLMCSIRATASVRYLMFIDPPTGGSRIKTSNSGGLNLTVTGPLWMERGQTLTVDAFSVGTQASVVAEHAVDDVPVFTAVYLGR